MTDPLYDKTIDDPRLTELENLLGDFAHRAPLRALPRRRSWRAPLLGAAAIATAAVIALVLVRRGGEGECPSGGAGFAFDVSRGAARCAGRAASRGTLPVGGWLETARGAEADVRIADIGDLTVYGDSRVRLVDTGAGGHRLELARGKIAAHVTAPPRLFVIDTPVASAVDLGCAYELGVDDDGRTHLRVVSGAVSLEGHGLVSFAPLGTEVVAVPGRGPGTPVAVDASDALRAAVGRFDDGDRTALDDILALAGPRDSFTLWNLLARTSAPRRAAIGERLHQLSPRPAWITAASVRAGDPTALEHWRVDLQMRWLCPRCVPLP